MKLGYIRVSTKDQNPARQVEGLQGICDQVMIEKASGASIKDRPVYDEVISKLGAGDTFVVWDLDRAFRSTVDAILELEKLQERGINFQIVTFNIDTSTPHGEFIYTMLAGLARMERQTIIKRTKEGLAAAKRRGVKLGRQPKLSGEQIDHAKQMIGQGTESVTSMARILGVHRTTLSRAVN